MTNAGRSRFIASQGGLPVVLYPTDQFPTIASIPTGAVVIDTTDGVVKMCRWVYSPTSTTSVLLAVPLIPDLSSDWSIKISFLDLNAAISSNPEVFFFKRTSSQVRLLQITRTIEDKFQVSMRNSDNTQIGFSTVTSNAVIQNEWNTVELYRVGDSVYLRLNDGNSVFAGCVGWDTTDYSLSSFYAWSQSEKPAYLAQFEQVYNGTVCDKLPLDESSGQGARNIITPSRTGTYGENSHTKALVPLSILS